LTDKLTVGLENLVAKGKIFMAAYNIKKNNLTAFNEIQMHCKKQKWYKFFF